jgi:hypothetical protein
MGIGNFFKTLFGNAKEATDLVVESTSQFAEEATEKATQVKGSADKAADAGQGATKAPEDTVKNA